MPEPVPPVPPAFLIVTFAVAIAVGVAVILLGIHGQLGGPIP
jgi:hypothetical protein